MKLTSIGNKSILIALFTIEFLFIILFINLKFETNDDTAMNLLSSGKYTGQPSEFIVFTNIIIGYVLKWLYTVNEKINWYSWYLVLSLFLGYVIVQGYILKYLRTKIFNLIAIHLSVFYFFSVIYSQIQFTRVAAILVLIGFVLLLIFNDRRKVLMGGFLVILGSLIRVDVLFIYILLVFPFAILLFYYRNFKRLVNISLTIFVCGILMLINNSIYSRKPDFVEYQKFNRLQYQITKDDNPSFKYENVKDILNNINWSFSDYDLATNFNIDLGSDKFSIKSLTYITKNIRKSKVSLGVLFLNFRQTTFIVFKSLYEKSYIIFFMFPLVFLILSKNFSKLIVLSIYFIYILGILSILKTLNLGNLEKERITWTFMLPFFCFLIIINFLDFKKSTLNKNYIFLKSYFYISILVILYNIKLFYFLNCDNNSLKTKEIYSIIKQQNDLFYVSWCGNEAEDILEMPLDYSQSYFLGWYAGTPFNKMKVSQYFGKRCEGIYGIRNKEIVWYFYNNNYFYKKLKYHEKVLSFYKTNFNKLIINYKVLPVNRLDTLFRYSFLVQ